MNTFNPEQLADKGIDPELFEAAENYARAVEDNPPSYPVNQRSVNAVVGALSELAASSIKHADSEPPTDDNEQALRWVAVAQKALKDCGRLIPELKGLEKSRQFSPSRSEEQKRMYYEISFNNISARAMDN